MTTLTALLRSIFRRRPQSRAARPPVAGHIQRKQRNPRQNNHGMLDDRELRQARMALPQWRVWRRTRDMPDTIERGTPWPIPLMGFTGLVAEYGPQLRSYPLGHGPIVVVQGTIDVDTFIRACRDAEPEKGGELYKLLWGIDPPEKYAWPTPGPEYAFADTPEGDA